MLWSLNKIGVDKGNNKNIKKEIVSVFLANSFNIILTEWQKFIIINFNSLNFNDLFVLNKIQ